MARGWVKPPAWAVSVVSAGVLFLGVGYPLAADRGSDVVHTAEGARISVPTVSPAPIVAFIGDSYAAGAGATILKYRFTEDLSILRDWTQINLARGGTGYVTSIGPDVSKDFCGLDYCANYDEMVELVAQYRPTTVVVSGGRNDLGQESSSEYPRRVADFYAHLRESLPSANIIAISPLSLWDASDPPEGLVQMGEVIRSAVEVVDGTYVDVGQPLLGRWDLMSPDSKHPNNAGHGAIAAAIHAAIPDGSDR